MVYFSPQEKLELASQLGRAVFTGGFLGLVGAVSAPQASLRSFRRGFLGGAAYSAVRDLCGDIFKNDISNGQYEVWHSLAAGIITTPLTIATFSNPAKPLYSALSLKRNIRVAPISAVALLGLDYLFDREQVRSEKKIQHTVEHLTLFFKQ